MKFKSKTWVATAIIEEVKRGITTTITTTPCTKKALPKSATEMPQNLPRCVSAHQLLALYMPHRDEPTDRRHNKAKWANRSALSHIHCRVLSHWGVYKPLRQQRHLKLFSAFRLRLRVVSVLVSVISDTRFIEPHDINLIFLGDEAVWWLAASSGARRLGIPLLPRIAHPFPSGQTKKLNRRIVQNFGLTCDRLFVHEWKLSIGRC